jgi:group I intron endonuclease
MRRLYMLPYDTPPNGGGLYVIWLSDTHFYGGRARSFKTRWRTHLRKLKDGKHKNTYMQNVFNKHGRFEPKVLVRLKKASDQVSAEQRWLDENHGTDGCVNLSNQATGRTEGFRHSEETKEKMAGRKVSEATRRKISNTLKGRKLSAAHRQAISESNKGKTLSEEHRQTLIECNRQREWTPEMRQKHSEAHLGNTHSEATKAKMSRTRKSRPDLVEKARKSLAENSKKITSEARARAGKKSGETRRGTKQDAAWIEKRASKHRGMKRSEETRQRMREAALKRCQEKPQSHSAATRAKISQQQKGRVWVNNGTKNRKVFPEEAETLLAQGWVRGRKPTSGS